MKHMTLAICAAVLIGLSSGSGQARDLFLGEVFLFGGTFCPRGSQEADGSLLPISQNSALFSLFGTFYGGDGRTTFALPDLRGRAPIGQGAGLGLPSYSQGQFGGTGFESRSIQGGFLVMRYCVATEGIYPSRS